MPPLLRRQVSRSVTLFVCWISRCRIEASLFNSLHHSAADDFRLGLPLRVLLYLRFIWRAPPRCCHLVAFFSPAAPFNLEPVDSFGRPAPSDLCNWQREGQLQATLSAAVNNSVDQPLRQLTAATARVRHTPPTRHTAGTNNGCGTDCV